MTNEQMIEGYRDGGDPDSPEPSDNRSHSYRHGFAVRRADRTSRPAFGGVGAARKQAAIAESKDALTTPMMAKRDE